MNEMDRPDRAAIKMSFTFVKRTWSSTYTRGVPALTISNGRTCIYHVQLLVIGLICIRQLNLIATRQAL
jgi:hypothetical protein